MQEFFHLAQSVPDAFSSATQLGVSSLMGALWWWERRYSRQREDELSQAHHSILAEREHLNALLGALRDNTQAISGFSTAQEQTLELLREIHARLPVKPPA